MCFVCPVPHCAARSREFVSRCASADTTGPHYVDFILVGHSEEQPEICPAARHDIAT